MAIKGVVARGCHYPLVPTHITEVHVQGMPLAAGLVLVLPALFAKRCLAFFPCVEHRVPAAVMAVRYQQRPSLRPRVLVRVQGPAHSDVPATFLGVLPAQCPLLWMKHLHHEAMVVAVPRGPLKYGGADIKALPAAQRVLHEPSVQQASQRFPTLNVRNSKYLIDIDTMETTSMTDVAGVAAVSRAVVGDHSPHDLIPVDTELCRGDELPIGYGSEVEVELLCRFAFQAGQGLHRLYKR